MVWEKRLFLHKDRDMIFYLKLRTLRSPSHCPARLCTGSHGHQQLLGSIQGHKEHQFIGLRPIIKHREEFRLCENRGTALEWDEHPQVCDLISLDAQTVKNRWELMLLMQICWVFVLFAGALCKC